jgi:hypothetical protein
MTEKRIALFVISISSIPVWGLLNMMGIIGGKMQTALVFLSLIPFIYSSVKLLIDYKFESSYFKFVFTLFIIYQLVIVVRGFSLSYKDIKDYLQTYYIFWPFIIPLFIFFNKDIPTFGFLFKWIYYSGIFFLVISLFFPFLILTRSTAETFIAIIIPCGFLLLNATYLRTRKVNISFLIISISIIALTYLARRSSVVTLVGFVISSYFLNLINKSNAKIFRYFPLIIIIIFFILFSSFFENSKEVLLNKMTSRISEDTRTGVFNRFFYYLKDDMTFGNGMNGVYYCPMWETEIDGELFGEVEYRNLIENGYLQLMLTGGVVHIVLFLLVLLPSAIKGIFMSSNQFVKACGIVIFLRLIDMLLYGMPSLSLAYILVWICVGVCYKTSIRRMTNDEIRSEFKKIDLL